MSASGVALLTGTAIGCDVVGAAFESSALDSCTLSESPIAILDSKIKTSSKVANAQVLLSKKSDVFLTPPTCWLPPPPNEEDNPRHHSSNKGSYNKQSYTKAHYVTNYITNI